MSEPALSLNATFQIIEGTNATAIELSGNILSFYCCEPYPPGRPLRALTPRDIPFQLKVRSCQRWPNAQLPPELVGDDPVFRVSARLVNLSAEQRRALFGR
jgi:hypothetical protein